MIKVSGLSKILILILCLFCLVSCRNNEFNIEEYNSVFFEHFSSKEDIQAKTIDELKLIYYDTYYYYDVTYYDSTTNRHYELLYVLRYGSFKTFFSIKNHEDAMTYCTEYYTKYLEGLDSGKAKIYTNNEIQEMIDFYYN